jgi:hypothetical protein
MMKKILAGGALLFALYGAGYSQPPNRTDTIRNDIKTLEQSIVRKAEQHYKRIETDKRIIYKNLEVRLDGKTQASVIILYDKNTKRYEYLHMNIHSTNHGDVQLNGYQTIEQHLDHRLDGYYEPSKDNGDSFNEYDDRSRKLMRENQLCGMDDNQIDAANKQLIQRLKQLDASFSR